MTRPLATACAGAVRWAGIGDAETLSQIHAASADEAWSAEALRTLLQLPGVYGLLIEAAGAVSGFTLCRVAADEVEVLTLVVLPAVRRRGYGRTLLGEAMDVARLRGAVRVFLEVSEANPPARALYEATGLQVIGRRRGYYRIAGRPAEDALIMNGCL